MNTITFFVIVATLATLAVLMAGGISMLRGGKYDSVHAFPLMEARVITQALAIGLVVIAVFFWS
jgi:hypothetical protein